MPLKYFAASASFAWLLFCGASAFAAKHNIYFKTSPRHELIRPFSDPANLSILVTDQSGRPVERGWIAITLAAPEPSRWFSTDFPVVEGSRLLGLRLPLVRGKAEWRYAFPIRGEYRMIVDFITPEGKQEGEVFNFTIAEHRAKWLSLTGFTIGLFALGFTAGRIFSQPAAVRGSLTGCLAISLPFTALSALGAARTAAPASFQGELEVEAASVGRPATVRWRRQISGNAPDARGSLTLTITHMEKQKTVFAVEKLPVEREFLFDFHFTDGAEYRVRAVAELPGRPSEPTEQIVRVAAVEPPTRAVLAPMILFVAALSGGLAAGRWSRRKSAPPTRISVN